MSERLELRAIGGGPEARAVLAEIWNGACGPRLAITSRFIEYNLRPSLGAAREGRVAFQGETPVGFVVGSAMQGDPLVSAPEAGWIDAIAVRAEHQQRGTGGALLNWAEDWLRAQGCTRTRLGASLRPFTPGLPAELENEEFFRKRGFTGRGDHSEEWDVANDLNEYQTRNRARLGGASTAPAGPQEGEQLLEFLWREFPNRWRYEFEEFRREAGRMSDIVLLWVDGRVEGFCHLTFEDSERPIERYFPNDLPKPWGQLGAIGVSRAVRGRGLGGALLDAGLRRLQEAGVRGCVIDWTSLLDFYGKFGFRPIRRYLMLTKQL